MVDKVINVDFSKNKRKNKKDSFFDSLKNVFKKIFSSADEPTDPDDNKKKVIYYKKGIS